MSSDSVNAKTNGEYCKETTQWFLYNFGGDCVTIAVVGIFWALLQNLWEPYQQCIPGVKQDGCDFATLQAKDPRLAFPFKEETITASAQYTITMLLWVIPLLISGGFNMYRQKLTFRHHGRVFVAMAVQATFAAVVNQTLGKAIKSFTGRPRPNFYWILSHNPSQARLSLPSGHAQLSNTMLLLLFFHFLTVIRFLQYKRDGWKVSTAMRPHENRDDQELLAAAFFCGDFFEFFIKYRFDTLAYVIAFIPVVVGEYIGLTRIVDYYHHVGDVVAGACLGALLAFVSFNIYYTRIYGTLFFPVESPPESDRDRDRDRDRQPGDIEIQGTGH